MNLIKKYKSNWFSALIIILMIVAGILSIDIDRLLKFYTDPILFVIVFVGMVLLPLFFLFGFRVYLLQDKIIYKHNLLFRKRFNISELSQILYEPTWRGVTPKDSKTNMRSLQIVRGPEGLGGRIYLANGAFREEDLADIAQRLEQMNPRIELDTYTEALIAKYKNKK